MGIEENKASLLRMVEEVWNKGNIELLPELVSLDYFEPAGIGNNIIGLEGIKQHVTSLRAAFSDFKMMIDEMVCDGDEIATQLTWGGTFKQEYRGIKPNNKLITIKEAVFFYFKDAKQVMVIPYTSPNTPLLVLMGVNPPNGRD